MICPKCHTDNLSSARFCMHCAEPLALAAMQAGGDTTQPVTRDRPRYEHLLEAAFQHHERGETAEAILAAEGAVALEPNSSAAHSLLGILYEKKGDLAKAISQFETVVELNPDSASDREKLDALRLRMMSLTTRAAKSKLTESNWQKAASPIILGVLAGLIIFAVMWGVIGRRGAGREPLPGNQPIARTGDSNVTYGAPGTTTQMALGPDGTQGTSTSRIGDPNAASLTQESGSPQGGAPSPAASGASANTNSSAGTPRTTQPAAFTVGAPPPGMGNLVAVPPPATGSNGLPTRTPPKPPTKSRAGIAIDIEQSPAQPGTTHRPDVDVTAAGAGNTGGGSVSNAAAYEQQAEVYHQSGMYREALDGYGKAYKQAPSWRVAQKMAMCYQRLDQKDNAADYYRRAREMAQNDVNSGKGSDEAKQAIQTIDDALQSLGSR